MSDRPGHAQKVNYSSDPVMDHMEVPTAKNIDDSLRLEIRRIFARLISSDHKDTGEVACKLLCTSATCPWITENCAEKLYGANQ